jgi:hypothetical protein
MSYSIRHIDQILDENKPIWVRNVHKPRGLIILTMTDRSGRVQKLDIPGVKHPVCLSDRVTPDTLRNSRDLRDLIMRRVLEIVPPAEAEAYYETNPRAREDVDRAYQYLDYGNPEIRKMRETGRPEDDALLYHKQHDAIVVGENPGVSLSQPVDPQDVGIADNDEDGDVQARVKVLVAALTTREKKAREVRSELEGLDLSEADLAYIVANSQGLVEKYAKQEFAARRGQSLDVSGDSDED